MTRRGRPVRPESATAPSQRPSAHLRPVAGARAKIGARAELLRGLDEGLTRTQRRPPADSWAVRYLESSRRLPPVAPAPLSPAYQVKLAEEQADRIVEAIDVVLDGLDLSPEDWERGRKLAADALRAVSVEGWRPL